MSCGTGILEAIRGSSYNQTRSSLLLGALYIQRPYIKPVSQTSVENLLLHSPEVKHCEFQADYDKAWYEVDPFSHVSMYVKGRSQPSLVSVTTKYYIQQYHRRIIFFRKITLDCSLTLSFIIKGANFEFNFNFKVARLAPFKFKARGI